MLLKFAIACLVLKMKYIEFILNLRVHLKEIRYITAQEKTFVVYLTIIAVYKFKIENLSFIPDHRHKSSIVTILIVENYKHL